MGKTTVEARADAWYSFRNVEEGVLRHTAIHGTGQMTMEFAPE